MRDPDMPLAGNPGTLLLKRLNVFFVCQPEPLKEPPNGTGIDKHAAVRAQAGRHFVQCDLAFGLDRECPG